MTVPHAIQVDAPSHISTESRYTGARSSNKYTEEGSVLSQLYRDCKAHCTEANWPFVSFDMHRKIFNCESSLEFFKPEKGR